LDAIAFLIAIARLCALAVEQDTALEHPSFDLAPRAETVLGEKLVQTFRHYTDGSRIGTTRSSSDAATIVGSRSDTSLSSSSPCGSFAPCALAASSACSDSSSVVLDPAVDCASDAAAISLDAGVASEGSGSWTACCASPATEADSADDCASEAAGASLDITASRGDPGSLLAEVFVVVACPSEPGLSAEPEPFWLAGGSPAGSSSCTPIVSTSLSSANDGN